MATTIRRRRDRAINGTQGGVRLLRWLQGSSVTYECRARAFFSGLFQREDFRMRTACPAMVTLPDDAFLGNNDGPDHGVGAGRSPALRGKAKGKRHVPAVGSTWFTVSYVPIGRWIF